MWLIGDFNVGYFNLECVLKFLFLLFGGGGVVLNNKENDVGYL